MAVSSNLVLRHMRVQDISQVMAIDEVSFKPPWPERSYRFEINESQITHMATLEKMVERPVQGLRRIFKTIRGDEDLVEEQSLVVAYGGIWKIADEAHINTIASHPDHRGNKYGEIVLAGMIRRAINLKADFIVLEVRVSNMVAQKLYRKYGFTIHGVKKDYYHHDKEDAYDMRVDLTPAYNAQFEKLYDKLHTQITFHDDYAIAPHPRLGI